MPTPLLSRQAQCLAEIETTAGTMETLVAADNQGRISTESSVEVNYALEPRDIARSSLTPLGDLSGEKSMTFTIKSEINPSDTVTDALENADLIQACGHTITDLKGITIGAVTDGPFTRGETVTDVSGATARVVVQCANGTTTLLHDPISGTLASGEVLTGSSSAATATTSSTPSNSGHLITPISDSMKTASVELQKDGFAWSAAGCMGNMTGTFESSKKGYWTFTMQGPKNDAADKAMTSGLSYQTEQPAVLQGASLTVNDVAVVARSITFDEGAQVVLRPDMNVATTGIISAYISKREPTVTMSFEHIASATLDIFGLMAAGTKMAIEFQLGTATGKTVHCFFDYAQITNIALGDNDGILTVDVTFKLTGAAAGSNDEYEFAIA